MTTTTDIAVSAGSGARNGTIILNAQNGPLNIPASTTPLSVAGTGNIGGGLLLLMGQSVNFAGTVELNASQTTTTGFGHEILIDAATITYSGNLTLDSNGPGTAMYLGGVGLQYFGATAVTVSGGGSSMTINVGSAGNAFSPLTVIGGGTLDMTGNGDNTVAAITAYPIAITGGSLTLQSQGTTNHGVYISNGSALTGQVGLTFGETSGTVTLDATPTPSSGAGGGYIQVNVDGAAFNAPTFVINASATSGNAQGGTVTITSSNLQLNTNSEATVTANGEGSLTGASGGTITITSTGTEPITLGTGAGDFSLTANSGATAGAGGTVEVTTGGELSLTGNFSVTAKGNGTGGTINLTGSTINIPTTSNTVLTATSAATEGNGTGGKISLTATGAGVTIGTGDNQISLNASDSTSGGGGFVAVTAAGPITAQGSAINVAAGPTSGAAPNAGGTITLTTSSGSISASGTFQASGGPLGSGGTINFQSAQDIDLADQTQLLAQGNGSGGAGGQITMGAGTTAAAGAINYATSNISINASGQSSKGGNIAIQTADPTGTGVLNILGPITNNGGVIGAGTVTVTNKYATGVRVNTAIISALNGQINFTSTGASVTVTGIAPSGMPGPYFGPVSLSGTDLTLQATGSATLVLGDFDASGDIQIQTDIGNMMSDGSDVVETTGSNGTITFVTTSGEVGTSTSPVNVAADNVDFNLGSPPASGTSINLNVTGDVTIENVASYGNVFITGDENITLSQNIQTTQGNVVITSTGGAIVLNTMTGILAQEGNLFLQGATSIALQFKSTLKAITTTANKNLGNVTVSLNGPPALVTGVVPANVTITSGAPNVFFGAIGIIADAPENMLSSTGLRNLAFDTNGLPAISINLGGSVNISAAGN